MNKIYKYRIGFYLVFAFIFFLTCQSVSYLVANSNYNFFLNKKIFFYFTADSSVFVMTILVLGFIVFSIYELRKESKRPQQTFYFSLILGGGLSNLVDRFFYEGVIDYFNLLYWKMNIADILILIGVILVVADCLFLAKKK